MRVFEIIKSSLLCSDDHVNARIPSLVFDFFLVSGIANVRIPLFFRTLYDSEIKLQNGLKCCSDSSAVILSIEFDDSGNLVAVELIT